MRAAEEELLARVRDALGAKHVIRVCSSYDQARNSDVRQHLPGGGKIPPLRPGHQPLFCAPCGRESALLTAAMRPLIICKTSSCRTRSWMRRSGCWTMPLSFAAASTSVVRLWLRFAMAADPHEHEWRAVSVLPSACRSNVGPCTGDLNITGLIAGASIAIDDCYELWESGFISIPYNFQARRLLLRNFC